MPCVLMSLSEFVMYSALDEMLQLYIGGAGQVAFAGRVYCF